jgi:hypothetical protein
MDDAYYANCMITVSHHRGTAGLTAARQETVRMPNMFRERDVADPGKRREGRFILLVGPDGSGKSTLGGRLVEELTNRFEGTRQLHWRPTLLPQAGAFLGRSVGDTSSPHAKEPHGRILSTLVLLYYWLDFFLGGWLKTWGAKAARRTHRDGARGGRTWQSTPAFADSRSLRD